MDRRSHNIISKHKYSQGKELVSNIEIESILVQHFYTIAKEPPIDISQFVNKFKKFISKLLTREDNHNLKRPVS